VTGIAGKRAVHAADRPTVVSDAAWHDLDVAFRAWAQAPTGESYRAFLDADQRWRAMDETGGLARTNGDAERHSVLAAH
jgi:hypothetical protein